MKLVKISIFSLVAMLTIFSSCKKDEEPVDSCSNGFLDPGEEGIDCGGNCAPCNFVEPAYLGLKVNGISVIMTTKSLDFDGSKYVLSMNNDSLSFSFNVGPDGTIGSFPLSVAGTTAMFNSVSYPNQSNGSYAISHFDNQEEKMSGFFQADFSRTGFTDTLHVTNGVFEYMAY